jgi:hypothetical protein
MHMKNTRIILCTLAVCGLAGCPAPVVTPNDAAPLTDGGHDSGSMTDTGGMVDTGGMIDAGNDAFVPPSDSGVPLTCAGYCTEELASCTGANAQYADMADCMAECTALAWTVGTAADTAVDTLGCRIYHSIAAAGAPATHCIHSGATGGNACGMSFRTDPAVEVAAGGTPPGYIRVDRMGMPAVATALIGPAIGPAASPIQAGDPTLKDTYNDGSPDDDAAFMFAGITNGPLQTLGTLHAVLDPQLRAAHLQPCSMRFEAAPVPGGMAPVCAMQSLDGNPAHFVAGLILPDTLRLDPAATPVAGTSHFPNGRFLTDPVIDITLGVLLTNIGSACAPIHDCLSVPVAQCTTVLNPGCGVVSGHCTTTAVCEAPTLTTATCATVVGCQPSLCGTGASMGPCTPASIASIPLNPGAGDHAPLTTFPYIAAHN